MATNNKPIYALLGLAVIGVGTVMLFQNKKSFQEPQQGQVDENSTEEVPQQSNLLDGNKLLKVGVNGLETKELQRLLGITQDGYFGNQTVTTLYNKKGVTQITLNQWITTANTTNPNIIYKFKVGDVLTVNASTGMSFPVYAKVPLTNTFTDTGEVAFFQNSQVLGKVVALRKSSSSKPLYLIQNTGLFPDNYYMASETYIRK